MDVEPTSSLAQNIAEVRQSHAKLRHAQQDGERGLNERYALLSACLQLAQRDEADA